MENYLFSSRKNMMDWSAPAFIVGVFGILGMFLAKASYDLIIGFKPTLLLALVNDHLQFFARIPFYVLLLSLIFGVLLSVTLYKKY